MSGESSAVRFLYGTAFGRLLLKLVMKTRADRLAVRFLRSPRSRPVIGWYARRCGIALTQAERAGFSTFQDFFARTRPDPEVDRAPDHLISPCDGYLSACPIRPDSSFAIKGSRYRVEDLLCDAALAARFEGGDCLILRLCASDFHHYCWIDDGTPGASRELPGELHSVQPIACGTVPVYTRNRRCWTLLDTDHFGPVVQAEIGALIVGGIVNEPVAGRVRRGTEKGHFELAGSSIALLFERDRIALRPYILAQLASAQEVRVAQGHWIGEAKER